MKVRAAYEEFVQDPANARLTQWTYRIITVKEQTMRKNGRDGKVSLQNDLGGSPTRSNYLKN